MKYLAFLSLVLSITTVSAHTWVDNIKVTGGTGPIDGSLGFIRGYVGHSDQANSYRIDKKQQSVYKENQRQPNQPNPKFQKLKASPGAEITVEWHENGHTTNDTPENNAPGYTSGKVFMYGTTLQPNPDLTLEQILTWKGDSPLTGRYLGSFNYDDGMCAEEGSQGRPLAIPRWASGGGGPCKGKFNLPQDLPSGQPYTVFWVWDFSGKVPGGKHFEWYSSVMDIDIVATTGKRDVNDGSVGDDANDNDDDDITGQVSRRDHGDDANDDDDDDITGQVSKRDHGDDANDDDDDVITGQVSKRDHGDDANGDDDDDITGQVSKRDHGDDVNDDDDGEVNKRAADDGSEDDDEDGDDDGKVNKRADDAEDDANDDDGKVDKRAADDETQPPLIKRSAKFRAAW